MTLTADTLKVVPVKCDGRIIDVVRCQLYLVMNDLTRLNDSFAQADLTQISSVFPISSPCLLPGFGRIEFNRKRFHCYPPPTTVLVPPKTVHP